MPNKKNSKQNIKVYGIFPASNPTVPVCITSTHDDALRAIGKIIFLNHYQHFSMWCALRNVAPEFDTDQWYEYATNTLMSEDSIEDTFCVSELYYSLNDIAAFMRMFAHCPILGLSYETEEEYSGAIIDSGLADKELVDVDEEFVERVKILSEHDDMFKMKYDISLENARKIVNGDTKNK